VKRFTQLVLALDATTKSESKLRALEAYFRTVPARDAAWALHVLTGGKLARLATGSELRAWVAAESGLPIWLVEESYASVGDLAETLALLVPDDAHAAQSEIGLADLIETRLLPLRGRTEDLRRDSLVESWHALDIAGRFVLNKLLTGSFRVGAARTQVLKALARAGNIEDDVLARRFLGGFEPTEAAFLRLVARGDVEPDRPRPYPFCLAHPIVGHPTTETWGEPSAWQIEWKWDGIRAQLVVKGGEVLVWTRGEELVTHRFPEVARLGPELPDGIALDGEILAGSRDAPLPFSALQKRIGRERPTAKLLKEVPVIFVAYDVLEHAGVDVRSRTMRERREILDSLTAAIPNLCSSPLVEAATWEDVGRERDRARSLGREGLMLKRRDSTYASGRVTGTWWKWKVDPYSIDAVLLYAQLGHGRRSELHTDYTFGLWHEGRLVPFAKAYSGLTDQELSVLDRHVRRNTTAKHGPVREVKPELVFEVAFEAVQPSTRHKCGLAVRFPRILRQRTDKTAEQADSLESLKGLVSGEVAR